MKNKRKVHGSIIEKFQKSMNEIEKENDQELNDLVRNYVNFS